MVGWDYPDDYAAFFEQDDATGYLYVANKKKILFDLHIYNRETQIPEVKKKDVEIVRSDDGSKFGVVIWKEIRGIIDVSNGASFKDNHGIQDTRWLSGFDYEFRPDTEGNRRAFICL
jgi:hypothetical protein